MDPRHRVYVLQNTSGKRYIGVSEDIDQRLRQHNRGDSAWTAKHRPWRLVWNSESMSLGEARKLENKLKRAKGGNAFHDLTGLPREGSSSRSITEGPEKG